MLVHKHIIINALVLNPPTCPEKIKKWIREVIDAIGMKLASIEGNPLSYYCTQKDNRGLTCVGILETSHCSLHSWDEEIPGTIQFDIYSCGGLDLKTIFGKIEEFAPTKISYKFLDREKGLNVLSEGSYEVARPKRRRKSLIAQAAQAIAS